VVDVTNTQLLSLWLERVQFTL